MPKANVKRGFSMRNQGYRSLRKRANFAMLFLGIYCFVLFWIMIVHLAMQNNVWKSSPQEIQAILRAHSVLAAVYWATFIPVVVAFLTWLHRASSNLRYLGVEQKYSPRAGAVWWFVPIANLWMPYRVVREVWHGSRRYPERTHPLFTLWWWLWCIGGFLSLNILRGNVLPLTSPPSPAVLFVAVLPHLLLLATTCFLYQIVGRVTDHQESKIKLVSQELDPIT